MKKNYPQDMKNSWPGKWLGVLLFGALSFAFHTTVQAQCTNTYMYPSSAVTPAAGAGFQDVDPCNFAGDYAEISVTSGDTYTFSTCAADGFAPDFDYDTQLTLRNGSGVLIAYDDDFCGNKSKITWVATYTGVAQIHLNVYNCGSNSACSNIRVMRVAGGGGGGGIPAPGCVATPACVTDQGAYDAVVANDSWCCNTEWDGTCQGAYDGLSSTCTSGGTDCQNVDQWPNATVMVDPNGALTPIAANMYFGAEYSVVSGIVTGEDYQFAIASGAYITVREGAVGGPVVGAGFSPLTITATSTANLYIHYTVNAACLTDDFGSYANTVQCVSCSPTVEPPANDDCAGATVLTPGETCVNVTGDVAGSTESIPAIPCGGFTAPAAFDVWYQFVATGTSSTVIVQGSASFDPVVDIRQGTCNGTNITCGDAGTTFGSGETVTFPTTIGNTYLVRVYHWGAALPATTTFDICVVSETPEPLEAPCTNEGFGQFPFSTLMAPTEGGVNSITTASATGDYHVVALNAGDTYAFSTSEGDNYYTITDASGTVVQNHGPEPHSFTPGAPGDFRIYIHDNNTCTFDVDTFFETFWECTSCPIMGCMDAAAINYDPAATVDDGSCFYPISSCGPDTYTYCYGNSEDTRFYYEAASGSDLYVQLNGGEVEGGWDDFYVWDNFDGAGAPLYSVSGPLAAGTILHSATGQLMVQFLSDGSVNCGTQGYDHVSYTIRCNAPVANSDCGSAQNLSVATFPATSNSLGSLWFVETTADAVCAGSPGASVYYSFNVATTNTAIVSVNPFGGADVVVEVLDACAGTVLACVNNNGAGGAESALLETLTAGTYTVRVHNASGDLETQSSGNFLINVQQLPYAGVQNNPNNILYACNQTDFALEDFVGATPQTTPWVLDYQWLIGEVGGGLVNEWQRGEANYSTRISWLGMDYGSTYNVFVRVLIDHPVHGEIWTVYPGDYANPNMPGAASCTITTSGSVSPTELRPNYTPTNAAGNDYAMCDIALAYNVQNSENFRWRFDPDMDLNNANEIYYTRGSGNPSVRLSWVNGLIPGITYNVAVEVQVNGQWSGFSTVLPLSIALPPNDVTLRNPYCGGTYAPNGYILSESVCEADFYTFEFVNTVSGSIHTRNSNNYVAMLNGVSPALTPGDYNVRVKVTQNGVPGDFGPSCVITISGPGMAEEGMAAMKSIESNGSATLFPNPNAGSEVRVSLDGLSDGNHDVNIVIYDIYGKMISSEGFGHEGTQLNRLVRFDGNLSTGMYMVQILVDGEQFATERLIVK